LKADGPGQVAPLAHCPVWLQRILLMATSTFASRAFRFYTGLVCPKVRRGITVMNPYTDAHVRGCVRAFFDKYFSDNVKRVLVFGINPGRFGAGITGINFTDPNALAENCGIANNLQRRPEISSGFIYKVIEKCGGPRAFYSRFFLSAVSPLGFTRAGKNLNYYEDSALTRAVTPFIIKAIEQQIALGGRQDRAIVLGVGKNARFLQKLNAEQRFFDRIDALEHPRWIMNYKRPHIEKYLAKYLKALAC
jgi:hypothetical protein